MLCEEIKSALRQGAKQSAAFWKPVVRREKDYAWKQIAQDIALDDTVSIAAGILGYSVWNEGHSFDADGAQIVVQNEALSVLKDEWKNASIFREKDIYVKDLKKAIVIRATNKNDVAIMFNDGLIVEGDDLHVSDVLSSFGYQYQYCDRP